MPHAKIRFLEYRTEDKEAPGNYGLLDQTLAIMLVPVSMPIIYAVAELSRMTLMAVAAVAVLGIVVFLPQRGAHSAHLTAHCSLFCSAVIPLGY
ncbi:hypothetical protein DAPPUDRAFT_320247 [Daphnia pulex]|uniref:Uncharacterized protein n=1 Tax=Daphnia pulex TaxID=6669 RepID=E9GPB2_DAPPU|nr:hypothetical protein DAPPUDRAFT_320247 [Daphnia pulex]|eukprot:EFX78611.1 hypothetical protein DAPPUDRAFT_320247 [Daphnia pulex]